MPNMPGFRPFFSCFVVLELATHPKTTESRTKDDYEQERTRIHVPTFPLFPCAKSSPSVVRAAHDTVRLPADGLSRAALKFQVRCRFGPLADL